MAEKDKDETQKQAAAKAQERGEEQRAAETVGDPDSPATQRVTDAANAEAEESASRGEHLPTNPRPQDVPADDNDEEEDE